jgi:hypothetical protein
VSGKGQRFDICDTAAFLDTGYVFSGVAGAAKNATLMAGDVTKGFMPPPPAAELPSYEKEVIANWQAINGTNKTAPCGRRPGNHKPTIKVIRSPKYADGGVTVTLEIADADHDQVVGTLFLGPDCDPTPPDTYNPKDPTTASECMMRPRAAIPSSGRHVLTITDGVDDGAPLTVRVADGWGPAAVVKQL